MNRAGTVIDLFAGAGGFSLGLAAAGAQITGMVERDLTAAQTLRANFDRIQTNAPPLILTGLEGDLEHVDLEQLTSSIGMPDILVGGPPCQGFSRIGRAKLTSLKTDSNPDPRNALYRRFVEAARLWQPRAVLMENVPGMTSVGGQDVRLQVAEELAGCGYRVGHVVLNAAWYGVPQFRERLFFIGFRSDLGIEPVAPVPTHRAALPSGYVRPLAHTTVPFGFVRHYELSVSLDIAAGKATTTLDALEDLPSITEHLVEAVGRRAANFRLERPYSGAPRSRYARLMRSWPKLVAPSSIVDHVVRRTPRDYETFRLMRPDDRYPQALAIAEARLQSRLQELETLGTTVVHGTEQYDEIRRSVVPPYPEDKFVDKWRKLDPDAPSWTVPAHLSRDAYSHIHYDDAQARSISVREAARLQSFPDGFAFAGNMGDCFTQIGNAVPPLLAWALGSMVLGRLGLLVLPVPP